MKLFITVALCFLFSIHLNAQKEKTTLWKISGNGIAQASYIYGTFHLLCENDIHIPDTLRSIIHQSKQIFFEIKMDDAKMNEKVMQNIRMQNNHQLKDYVDAAQYDTISKIFQQKTRFPLEILSAYKPYFLVPLLYPAMLGCTPATYELQLMQVAKKDSLPVYGLETLEMQMQVFDSIGYDIQAKELVKSILQFDDAQKELKRMVALYETKDIIAMQKAITVDTALGNYEDLLLTKRNKNWIPIISNEIAKRPTVFAVGAGHLGGEKGILYLLRKKGYTVTPVYF